MGLLPGCSFFCQTPFTLHNLGGVFAETTVLVECWLFSRRGKGVQQSHKHAVREQEAGRGEGAWGSKLGRGEGARGRRLRLSGPRSTAPQARDAEDGNL